MTHQHRKSGKNGDTERPRGELGTVLVVDDNQLVTRALDRILQHEGYRVAAFHNGREALAYMEKNSATAAVVDIHLPDISGLVLSSKLRQVLGAGSPIIVLSGDTSMENIRSLQHVGATYFMSKPFKPEHLVERLRELAV